MSNDTTVTVYFVKHWDNDIKGYIEVSATNILHAINTASWSLINDAQEDGVDEDSDPAVLFTITKAEFGQGSNWNGGPR